MELIRTGRLDPSVFDTHRLPLDEAMSAYDAFGDAAGSGAFKVVLEGAKDAGSLLASSTATA
jgi:threonine dehydrogenase-like Zn-dependent dehydrogenase